MTADELAALLHPVGLRLLETDDDVLSRDVVLAKTMLLFILAWLEQLSPGQRRQNVNHLAIHLAGLYAAIRPEIEGDED